VNEYPVFVPFEADHLATVIAVPDGEPRGLALLSTGVAAPRSHRFQMWSRTAERLADVGVASARWEYRGTHDSTGTAHHIMEADIPVDQLRAVARFAQRAVGVEQVVTVGNCLGAQAGLSLAAELPECVGAVCLLPQVVEPVALRKKVSKGRAKGLVSSVRSIRAVRRRLVNPLRRLTMTTRSSLSDPLPAALDHGKIVFLFDQENMKNQGVSFRLRQIVNQLDPRHRERLDVRVLPVESLDRFGNLETQAIALETIVEWIDRRFAELATRPEPVTAVPGSEGS